MLHSGHREICASCLICTLLRVVEYAETIMQPPCKMGHHQQLEAPQAPHSTMKQVMVRAWLWRAARSLLRCANCVSASWLPSDDSCPEKAPASGAPHRIRGYTTMRLPTARGAVSSLLTVPCHFLFQAISKIQVLVVGEVPVRHNMSKPPEDSRAVREKLAKAALKQSSM